MLPCYLTCNKGDTVCLYALDRLGRDALDVQSMVRFLLDKSVMLDVRGLGVIGRGASGFVVAVLAQIADRARQRIKERCDDGRTKARASLVATGKTHRGKVSLGCPMAANAAEVAGWRKANGKSIRETCEQFGLSKATVARYCAAA